MPPARSKVGPELDIQLDQIGRPYQAGDTITGRVVRRLHAVSPRVTVTIQLLGRAKSKIIVKHSNGGNTNHSYYRGRFNFFEAAQTQRLLHAGPVHVPPGGGPEVWEFAIDVPLTPSPAAVGGGDTRKEQGSLLSLSPNDIAACPLPSSFYTEGRRHNTKFEGYVEYHLEASFVPIDSKQGKAVTAILPIKLCAPSTPYPLVNFDLKRFTRGSVVSTYRLVPGMENAELSFKQKSQKFFHSSKVPTLGLTMECSCPSVIQLGNPTPIPLLVRLISDRRHTSEVLHDVPEIARLEHLELVLKARTAVVARGAFGMHDGDDTIKHHINVPLKLHSLQGPIPGPSNGDTAQHQEEDGAKEKPPPDYEKIPKETSTSISEATHDSEPSPMPGPSSEELPTYKASTKQPYPAERGPLLLSCSWRDDDPPFDLGAAVGLRIYPTYAMAVDRAITLGRPVAQSALNPICPGFTTYCIRHSHLLKWKIVLGIAGETIKLEYEQPVTVMGQSQA